jgi:hypothetical protein
MQHFCRNRCPSLKPRRMLYHQLKTAWRNLIRQKGYTLINILGLSIGVCSTLVIYLIKRLKIGDQFARS